MDNPVIKVFPNNYKAIVWYTDFVKDHKVKECHHSFCNVYNEQTNSFDKYIELKLYLREDDDSEDC